MITPKDYIMNLFFSGKYILRYDEIQMQGPGTHIGQKEKDRRLFICVLECLKTSAEIAVATAHFTWQGHISEYESGVNVRKEQAERASNFLLGYVKRQPVIFGGDLNESFWPKRIFEKKGFKDCFETRLPVDPLIQHDLHLLTRNVRHLPSTGYFSESKQNFPQLRVLLSSVIKDMRGLSSDDPDEKKLLAVQPRSHARRVCVLCLESTTCKYSHYL